jgi:hypothetical protein
MTDAGDAGHGDVAPPPMPPVPPGGWQAPTPAPPSAPPPAPAPHHGAPPPTGPAYPAAPPPAAYGQPQAYGPPQGYAYGYPTAPRNDGMAIAALCCGIAAIPLTLFCGLGVVLGVLGLVFGLVSMRKIDRAAGALTGRGMALAGVICGAVGLVLSLGYWVIIIIAAASDSNAMGALAAT